MIDCGEIGELSEETSRIILVTWRIENFFSLSDEVNAFHSSPHFYISNSRWSLKIYQNGDTKHASEGCIGVYLKRSNRGPPTSLRYEIFIRKADGTVHSTFRKIRGIFSDEQPKLGYSKFLQRSELLSRKNVLAPSDTLTVICKIYSNEPPYAGGQTLASRGIQSEGIADSAAGEQERVHLHTKGRSLVSQETQTEGIADSGAAGKEQMHLDSKGGTNLHKHLKDLLLHGKDHDVTFKVKDRRFRVHKSILRARSHVFAAMFDHNMKENESGEVLLEDRDPTAFAEFLKYVYTGKLENLSTSIATGLYYAAHRYDFPDLKEACVELLKASLTTKIICNVIALAMKYHEDELFKSAMDFLSEHLMETMRTVEWDRFLKNNPSAANRLLIKAMNMSHKSTE